MKKKLLFSNVGHQWNALLKKFLKVQKKINSPEFSDAYTIAQQRRLFSKLKNLYNRLLNMQHQVGVKIAGTAVGLMMIAATANAQYWQPADTLDYLTPPEGTSFDFSKFGVADIDGDGNKDIILGSDKGKTLIKFMGEGSGTWNATGEYLFVDGDTARFSGIIDPSFADLDDDGDMDMVVADFGDTYLHKFMNDGSGEFTSDGVLLTFQEDTIKAPRPSIEFADMDDDGEMDLYLAHGIDYPNGWKTGYVIQYLNNSGNFFKDVVLTSETGDTIKSPWWRTEPALSDFDLDGDIDLLIAMGGAGSSTRSKIFLWENVEGTLTESGPITDEDGNETEYGSYNAITFADIDDDVMEELFVLSGYGNYVGLTIHEYFEPGLSVGKIESKEVRIYPNPATEYIEIQGLSKPASVKVYNLAGSLENSIESVTGRINVSGLSKGMYLLEIGEGRESRHIKFIKE